MGSGQSGYAHEGSVSPGSLSIADYLEGVGNRSQRPTQSSDALTEPRGKDTPDAGDGNNILESSVPGSADPDIRYTRNDSVRRLRMPNDIGGRNLSIQNMKGVALRVLKVDPERAGVRVVSGFDGLSPALRKALAQEGAKSGDLDVFHWRGKSYLLADMMHSKADVQKAISHEHYTHGSCAPNTATALATSWTNC